MDCVEVKQETTVKTEAKDNTCLFDGNNDGDNTNDPFNNSSDESIYEYNSDNDPFKEEKDYQSNNEERFEASNIKVEKIPQEAPIFKVEKIPQEAPILNESVVKETSSTGATLKDYIHLPNDEYGCKHCDYVTNTRQNVSEHLKRIHMNCIPMKQCPHCSYKAKEKKNLEYHIISRHKKESEVDWFECYQCGHKFLTKNGLLTHLRIHRTYEEKLSSMIKCNYCPKMFQLKHYVRKHIRMVHDRNKPDVVTCHLCGQKYCDKKTLIKHIKKCHDNAESLKMRSCEKCNYKTKFDHSFYRHLQMHLKKRFQCEKCTYQANEMQKMKLHEINHQEVKDEKDLKYRCDKCDYKTYRVYSFQVHKLKHLKPEDIQYFYCYHCEFKAKRKDNLKTHIQSHFKKKTEFVCYICDFKTNNKGSHIAHLGKHSREQNEEFRILNLNQDEKKETLKRQSSSNKNSKAPLKRRKVIKNDDDAAVKPEKKLYSEIKLENVLDRTVDQNKTKSIQSVIC